MGIITSGTVIWYHPEPRMAIIERAGGFTVGMAETDGLELGRRVTGEFCTLGRTTLTVEAARRDIAFAVEGDALTEDQASELLGFIRD